VPSYSQKRAVEKAVKQIKDVRGIAQDLEVRYFNDGVHDDEVAGRVLNTLNWSVSIPKDIKVTVSNGMVTLTGRVDWQYQKEAAERSIAHLRGVRGVTNELAISPHVEPQDVKKRIEKALERQSEIEASRIHVTVDGSTVRLDGKVRAWSERDIAERAAWAAPGVRMVDDRMTVEL
jgi:osmotically-inducible protein OsmY